MTANHLNQLGLFLGLISGLLLIPEVFRLIPFEYLSERIDKLLNNFEATTKFPIRFHPPSWKIFFSAEQREKYIEPITAVSGLIFSIIWVASVTFGLVASSRFFIIVGFIPPSYTTIRRVIDFRNNVPGAKNHNFFVYSNDICFSFCLTISCRLFSSSVSCQLDERIFCKTYGSSKPHDNICNYGFHNLKYSTTYSYLY